MTLLERFEISGGFSELRCREGPLGGGRMSYPRLFGRPLIPILSMEGRLTCLRGRSMTLLQTQRGEDSNDTADPT